LFANQRREVEQRDKAPNFNKSIESAVKDKSCPFMKYELCGTVSHHGTLNQGHYVSNVKMNEEWFHCDDAFVTRSGEEEVLKDDSVYMMFYAKK
jgi:ubiquitin C-terminal hydrolase